MKKLFITFALIVSIIPLHSQVIAPSISTITTHRLNSGNVVLGISSDGGGYINMLNIPGKGDIMGFATDRYGRGGQSAMRDRLHGGRYNPTQAGFHETLGTPSIIEVSQDSLVIVPRMCSLWHGDGKYDYVRWENIGADPYQDDGGNSDIDNVDEEELEGKQLTEVGSEFDYYGVYENYMGQNGVTIPCFRHYYEYRFIRSPGHCLSQFAPGSPIYNESQIVDDISRLYPEGTHKATAGDISGLIKVWSLRNDRALWDPPYRHLITTQGTWVLQARTDDLSSGGVHGTGATYQALVILSDSQDRDKGVALGLYRPASEINSFVIVGIEDSTGNQVYKDDRTNNVIMLDQPARVPAMTKYGFLLDGTGMLNRQRTDSTVYEMLRSEFYILVGTPHEIFEAANSIQELTLLPPPVDEWNFDTDLEGWTLTKNLKGNVDDSILNLEIQGPDPYMTSLGNLQIDAGEKTQLWVKMKNGTPTASGKIFWLRDTDKAFSPQNSLSFDIQPQDSAFSTYQIDLKDQVTWSGTITQLRLDPSNDADSGSVQIDFIKAEADLTAAISRTTEAPQAQIFPVPAKGYFVIEVASPSRVCIFDIHGKVVCNRPELEQKETISCNDWTPGLYVVTVANHKGVSSYKLLVE